MRILPLRRSSQLGALMLFAATATPAFADENLALTKTAPAHVNAGENLTYSLSVENVSPTPVYNVTVRDPLPANTTFVSVRQTGGPALTFSTPAVGSTGTVSADLFQFLPTKGIGSSPMNFVSFGNVAYFVAHNGQNGTALWKTDGTASGTLLVKDFPGSNNTGIQELTRVGNNLFFSAQTGSYDRELWKSDGTPEGTVRVKDIAPGMDKASNPKFLTNVGGTLFFQAQNESGTELWKSDGTEAGTVLVKDIVPGSNASSPSNLTNVGGTLFFQAYTPTNGFELWKSDGTEAGTVLVKDIVARQGGSSLPTQLTNVGGTLFFTATDDVNGTELWKSDGTEAGTVLVKDISEGNWSSSPANLVNFNGTLFFSASTLTNNGALWKSDGTAAGTVQVKNLYPGESATPSNFVVAGNTLFFTSRDGATGVELWKSDGTPNGTVLVKDIFPGSGTANSSNPSALTNVNGVLYFQANDGTAGRELWKSDGTTAGTVLVKDIFPGASDSAPALFCPVNGTVVFAATDDQTGRELWKTDGTAASTSLVKDITGIPTFEIVVKVGAAANGTTLTNTANVTPTNDPSHYTVNSATARTTVGGLDSLVVNRADDTTASDGQTTLREAVNYARTLAGTPTITFDPNVFGAGQTIRLGGSELSLDHNLIIHGPGARLLTIDAGKGSRAFTVANGINVSLEALSIRGGVGSAIFNQGALRISACTLSDNEGTFGGALFNATAASQATLVDSTLSDNNATSGGSAVFNKGQLLASNSTFSRNTGAGATIDSSDGSMTLNNCTIARNSTASSAALSGDNLTLNNSVVVTNSGVDLSSNGVVRGDYNLLGVVSGATFAGTNNQTGVSDAGLDTLKNNGGPTDTVALLEGSAAINAGDPAFEATTTPNDQRGAGYLRVRTKRLDVGAFESGNASSIISSVTLSPTAPQTNDTLKADVVAKAPQGEALTTSYAWKKNGQLIVGETKDSLDLSKAGNGDKGDQISCVVTVKTESGSTMTRESEVVTVGNSVPVIQGQGVTFTPHTPRTDDVLTASVPVSDADNESITLTYQWFKNGELLAKETGKTLDLSTAGNGDKGDTISVTASASDGSASVSQSSPAVTIVNSAPTTPSVTLIPDTLSTNDIVTAKATSIDSDGDAVKLTYQWQKNGQPLAGETGNTLDLSKDGNGDRGDLISVSVLASDGSTSSFKGEASATIANSVATAIALSPNTVAENSNAGTLVGTLSTRDADTSKGETYKYTLVNGVGDSDNTSFFLEDDQVKTAFSFDFEAKNRYSIRVKSTDEFGQSFEAPVTIEITDVNEAPTVTVSLSPSAPLTNDVLQAKAVGHDGEGDPVSFTYEWKKNGTVLPNEKSASLNLSKAGNGDKNDVISVTVTPRDKQLSGAPASASTVVFNSLPTLGTATFTGRENTTLNARLNGQDADADTLQYKLESAPRYGTLQLQSGGTFSYVPNRNWNGNDRFVARVTDNSGAGTTTTFAITISPVNGVPVAVADTIKATEDVPLTIPASALLGNDSNGESAGEEDPLTITQISVPKGFPGTLSLNVARQTIQFTPYQNWNGVTSFTYTVQDRAKASATAKVTLQVAPVNDAPRVQGGKLSVISGTQGELQLQGSDVDGDALTFALSTKPKSGTAQVVKVGGKWVLRYTSKIGFSGTDTLTIVSRDAKLSSAPGTITITVKPNRAPQLLDLSPSKGNFAAGSSLIFEQKVRDNDGTSHLKAVALTLSPVTASANARSGAALRFDVVNNRFSLTKDDGTTTLASVALGGTLENSQVKVTLGTTDVERASSGTLTLRWRITFKSSFVGTKSLWGRVEDQGGLSAGFANNGQITLSTSLKTP